MPLMNRGLFLEVSYMIRSFFTWTAWPMAAPVPYSFLHIFLAAVGSLAAGFAAARLAAASIKPERVLFGCGLLLAIMELYKQGFLYLVVNGGHYDWWYFPFQLCSVPMYLCLIYPLVRPFPGKRARIFAEIIPVFLQDFGLLGGSMALAVPDGFLYPYWALTIHGFLWHFLLIFLSLYCKKKGLADQSGRGFARMLPLYFLCCGIAAGINTAVQLTVYPDSYADMFYINCFFPSEQPLFHQISLALGNGWGHLAYLLASCAGAYLVHRLYRLLNCHPI